MLDLKKGAGFLLLCYSYGNKMILPRHYKSIRYTAV